MLTEKQVCILTAKGYKWPEHSVKHKVLQIGNTYNQLTILAIVRNKPYSTSKVLCKCSCSNLTFVQSNTIANNMTKSCGCAFQNNSGVIIHGLSHLGIWKSWHNMVDRCTNINHPSYDRYSKLGYTTEWLDFECFYKDLKDTWFDGAHLDRIDNNKGYSPGNTQWLTHSNHASKTRTDIRN